MITAIFLNQIPPLSLSSEIIDAISKSMPELPNQKLERFRGQYNISDDDLKFLISNKNMADYFEEVAKNSKEYNMIINWIRVYVMQVLNRDKIDIANFSITPLRLAGIIELLSTDKITKDNAKKVFDAMFLDQRLASDIVNDMGMGLSVDKDELESIILNILSDNPAELDRLKNGEDKLIKFFMGLVMRETKGKYPPNIIIELLNKNI